MKQTSPLIIQQDEIEEARLKLRRAAKMSRVRHACWCAIMDAFSELLVIDDLEWQEEAPKIAEKYAQALMEQFHKEEA